MLAQSTTRQAGSAGGADRPLRQALRELFTNRNRLREFVFEQKCVPWRLKRLLKRHFLHPYRWLAFGRLNINTPEHWDDMWQREGLNTWRVYPARFTRILELVPAGSKGLDVGCGVGILLKRLQEERHCQAFGIDISPVALHSLRRRGLEGAVGSVPRLPIRSASFDFVVATEMIEHLDDPREGLQELVRCLRPGGRLILTTPHDTLGPEDEDEHMHRFTVEELKSLAGPELDDLEIEFIQEKWREDGKGSEPCILLYGCKKGASGIYAPAPDRRLRAERTVVSSPGGLPSLSVIIPTKDRPDDLELAVESLVCQSVLPRQVIIVDQSQNDESQKRVEKLFGHGPWPARKKLALSYIRDPGIPGAAIARNRGMEGAAGDVWLFFDDDVCLEPDFVEELLAVYLRHPKVDGVSGIITNYRPPSWPFRCWSWAFVRGPFHDERQPIYWRAERLRHAEPIQVRALGSGMMSFRASVIRGLHFDENLRGVPRGEDVDFCARLNHRAGLVIAPKARLVHKRSVAGRSRDHWLRSEMSAACYLYHRAWNSGLGNRLCFAWLKVGYALLAVGASVRRASLEPWRAFVAGLRDRSWAGALS